MNIYTCQLPERPLGPDDAEPRREDCAEPWELSLDVPELAGDADAVLAYFGTFKFRGL